MKKWALLLWLVSTTTFASIGSVVDLTGTAIIKRGKETITVSKGTGVETNDKVETKNGVVNIKFTDNTTVKVTENSALVIDDFVYDPKNAAGGKLGLKATAGTVRYVSGNIAHNNPNSVKINTPTAAIAVRGTDFVMAVDETGKSLIMLMPTCEIEHNINLKGLICGSGKIDVDSGSTIITLDKPYQATIVETGATPPSPPVIVNLSGTTIGNNLLIRPPPTMSGVSVAQAARSAAEKTGDAKRDDTKKDSGGSQDNKDSGPNAPNLAEAKSAGDQQKDKEDKSKDSSSGKDPQQQQIITLDSLAPTLTVAAVQPTATTAAAADAGEKKSDENIHVLKIHKNDNPMLQQLGWAYMSLSATGNNFTAVTLANDTKIMISVTQDRIIDSWNFAGTYAKPQGTIINTQSYK